MTGIILMSGGNNGADVSGVTATAQDVLSPKVIVDAQGNPITGVIPTYSGDNPIVPDSVSHNIRGVYVPNLTISAVPTEAKSATPSTQQQIITPTQGKFLSQVAIAATPTQSKTVTPTTSQQTVTPDSGKFLSSVVVNAAPAQKQIYTTTQYVTPSKNAQSITPPSGYDGMSSVYIYGDSNLVASNIKSGVSIFNVSGSYSPPSVSLQSSKTGTPGSSSVTVYPDSGYDGLQKVVISGDSDLTASNIKKGVAIFGVTGTYEGSSGGASTAGTTIARTNTKTLSISCSSSKKLVSFAFIAESSASSTEVVGGMGRRGSSTGRAGMGEGSVGDVLTISWGTYAASVTLSGSSAWTFASSYKVYYTYY